MRARVVLLRVEGASAVGDRCAGVTQRAACLWRGHYQGARFAGLKGRHRSGRPLRWRRKELAVVAAAMLSPKNTTH